MKRLFLLSVLCTNFLFSQTYTEEPSSYNWWGSIGGGIAGGRKVLGSAFGASLHYRNAQNLYSIRYVDFQNTPIPLAGERSEPSLPLKSIIEGAALYGQCEKKDEHFIAGSFGLGILQTRNYENSGGEIKTAIGVAFQAQALWNPLPYCGIGFYGFANINGEKNLYGMLFCLQVGKL